MKLVLLDTFIVGEAEEKPDLPCGTFSPFDVCQSYAACKGPVCLPADKFRVRVWTVKSKELGGGSYPLPKLFKSS